MSADSQAEFKNAPNAQKHKIGVQLQKVVGKTKSRILTRWCMLMRLIWLDAVLHSQGLCAMHINNVYFSAVK